MFYHFYDMQNAPPTFNIILQLISGELARREMFPDQKTHLVFVPGDNGGFNKLTGYDTNVKQWRFNSIVLPALRLLESIESFTLLPSREAAGPLLEQAGECIFPLGYTLHNESDCPQQISHNLNHALGFQLPSVRAPLLAHEYVKRVLKRICPNQEIVVITLRKTKYITKRNSDVSVSLEIAKYFQDLGFFVVILPDYETVFETPDNLFPGAYVFREAVINLSLRTALYEQAALNIGQPGGPLSCAYLNNSANYLMFQILVDDVAHASAPWLQQMGFAIGMDAGYYDTFARWAWEAKTIDAIIPICDEFIRKRRNGDSLQSENQFTPASIISAAAAFCGKETLDEITSLFSGASNGPVFINRETDSKSERQYVIRTKYTALLDSRSNPGIVCG